MGLHAPCLIEHPRFKVVSVCDIDPANLSKGAEYFGCEGYHCIESMLEAGDLDLVLVMVRSNDHCRLALQCLEAGFNTLVTKPWGVDAAEVHEMINTANRYNRRILFWAPVRWSADLEFLQRECRSIGQLKIIRRAHTTCSLRNDWQIWREFGGGYLLNWGPHLVDQLMVLAGSRVKSVNASIWQFWNPGDVEDAFKATLEFENGVWGEVELTQSPIQLPNWFLQGEQGAIQVSNVREADIRELKAPSSEREDEYRQNFTIESRDAVIQGDPFGDTRDVYDAIAGELSGEKSYRMGDADALHVAEVLDAIRESASTGLRVRLTNSSGAASVVR